jgi:hypothetical protein
MDPIPAHLWSGTNMRIFLVLMATTALAGCSGGEAQTAGSTAVGQSTGGAGGTTTASTHTFVAPTVTKTYQAQGAVQAFDYTYNEALRYTKNQVFDASGNPVLDILGNPTYKLDPNSRTLLDDSQGPQIYSANAATVRNPGITVTYDPKNAQYSIVIAQNGQSDNVTFQDPLHRTDFSGLRTPQNGVPNLEIPGQTDWRTRGVQYLEAGTGGSDTVYDRSTFFYELPGTTTKYVTYAGFVRNHYEKPIETLQFDSLTSQTTVASRVTKYERAAFVFGEITPNAAVPTTGSATFSGNMIASMVNSPDYDISGNARSYFQWLNGTATVGVNFGTGAVTTSLTGTTLAPLGDNITDRYAAPLLSPTALPYAYPTSFVPAGAAFTASGTARIDLVNTGGFVGAFSSAQFVFGVTTQKVDIVGSTLDGAFYGPKANEVGASFRIVGGIPDQRVDIIGSFTGKGN